MATDITTLTLGMDSTGIVKGKDDLNDMAKAADGAKASVDKFEGGMVQAQLAAKQLREEQEAHKKTIDGGKGAIDKMSDSMAAQVAIGTALGQALFKIGGALIEWVSQAMNAASASYILSQRMGVTVEELGGLQMAFKASNVEADGMQMAMTKLQQAAASDSDVLERLGISAKNANGTLKDGKQILYDLADSFVGTANGSEKTAIAMQLMGRGAAQMIPLLNTGSAGLKEMADLSDRLGLTMSTSTAEAGDKLSASLGIIGSSIQNVITRGIAGVLPALADMADEFMKSDALAGALAAASGLLGAAFDFLVIGLAVVILSFQTLGKSIAGVFLAMQTAAKGDISGALTVLKLMAEDIGNAWERTGKRVASVMNDTAVDTSVAATSVVKYAESTRDADKAAAKFAAGLTQQADLALLAAQNGGKLTASMKAQYDLNVRMASQSTSLGNAQRIAAEAAIDQLRATEKLTEAHKKNEAATKLSAKAQKELDDSTGKANDVIAKYIDLATEGKNGTLGYTNAQRAMMPALEALRSGFSTLSEAGKLALVEMMKNQYATEQLQPVYKRLHEEMALVIKASQAKMEVGKKEEEELDKLIAKQTEENEKIGLTKEQLAQLTVKRLDDAIGIAQQRLEQELKERTDSAELAAINKKIEQLTKLKALNEQGIILQSTVDLAKQAADEWQKTIDQIGQGLTDSLFRAFEAGKGFFQTLWDGIKNTFKTTVLKLIVNAVMNPITGAGGFLSTLAGGASASGGASAGGGAGLLSSISNLWTVGSTAYSAFTAGLTATLGHGIATLGTTFGSSALASFGAGMSSMAPLGGIGPTMAGAGGAAGAGASAAYAVPIVGWIAAAMAVNANLWQAGWKPKDSDMSKIGSVLNAPHALVNKLLTSLGMGEKLAATLSGSSLLVRLFGRKQAETTQTGISGTIQAGIPDVNQYQDWIRKGGVFRSDKTGTNTSELSESQAAFISTAALGIVEQTTAYAKALDMLPKVITTGSTTIIGSIVDYIRKMNGPTAAMNNLVYNLKVVFGADEEANMEALTAGLQGYQEALAATLGTALSQFQKAGETLTQTLTRLVELKNFSDQLAKFGGVFLRISNLGVDAKEALIEMAGGMEALMSRSGEYIASFYSDQEQYDMGMKNVRDALKEVGIEANVTTKAQYRALVDSRDINTELGRAQFVALMAVAPAFAQLADYIEQIQQESAAEQLRIAQELADEQLRIAEEEAAAAEAAAEAAAILAEQLGSLRSSLEPMGGIFATIAGFSDEALTSMSNLSGGMDQLASSTKSYYDSYYSDEEKFKDGMKSVGAALYAVGIEAELSTKAQFRALVDSRDLTTELGRTQLAALLSVASTFSELATYMETAAADLLTEAQARARDEANAAAAAADALAKENAAAIEAAALLNQQVGSLRKGFENLGGVFATISSMSIEATGQLAALAGGMDALVGSAKTYYNAFYNEQEKFDNSMVGFKAALAAVGLEADITTKAQFRALVESRDISTELGRSQLVALLAVAGTFADLADYMQNAADKTLADAQKAADDKAAADKAASDALAALTLQVTTMRGEFENLGGVFLRVNGLSIAATQELANFAGGMDQLIQKAKAYAGTYYSKDEQQGIAAKTLMQSLEAVGLPTNINTKDQFRAMVDSLDVSTELGRQQLAALLDIAPAFANMADYLGAANQAAEDQYAAALAQAEAQRNEAEQLQAQIIALDRTIQTGTGTEDVGVMRATLASMMNSYDAIMEVVNMSTRPKPEMPALLTLEEIAKLSPGGSSVDALLTGKKDTPTTVLEAVTTGLEPLTEYFSPESQAETLDLLTRIANESADTAMYIQDNTAAVDAARSEIVAAVNEMTVQVIAGLTSVAVAANATTAQLKAWDDGGAVVTTPLP